MELLHNKLLACGCVCVAWLGMDTKCVQPNYMHINFAGNDGSISTHSIISTSTVESVPPSFSAAAIVIIIIVVVVVWAAIIMIIIFVLLLQAGAPTLLLNAHEHTYIFLWLFARIQFVMMNFLPLSAFFFSLVSSISLIVIITSMWLRFVVPQHCSFVGFVLDSPHKCRQTHA